MKKILTGKNIFNVVISVLLLVLLFVPSAKAMLMQGLMQIGLFKPDTTKITNNAKSSIDLSGIHFKDAAGKIIVLGELKGKVVFLNFWATWCPPCLAEMPSINKMYERLKNDDAFVFIFVDADSNLQKAGKFMAKRKYSLPLYIVASDIPETIFSGSLPTTVVFDKQGRISYNESGAANYNDNKFITFMTKLRDMN